MTLPLVDFRDVSSGYGKVPILRGTSLHADAGELVSIIGPNGAGKSTVLKNIMGLVPIWSGSIVFDGKEIKKVPTYCLSRLGIGYVPQGRVVFPSMTIEENLLLGAFHFHRERHRVAERLDSVFGLFPKLAQRRRQDAFTLSGGEQQTLAIGRALMANPRLLLLDEPSLGLSPAAIDFVFDTLQRLRSQLAILMVEQNASRALEISDRAYVLVLGQNQLAGSGSDLLNDERVRQLYLGARPQSVHGSAA